jgi:transcriptional regulator with XRE-family HTH domain
MWPADVGLVNFGAALKSVRQKASLLQADLAKQANLDPSYVSLLENNRKSPTLTVYFRICQVLNIRPSEMMRRIEKVSIDAPIKPSKKGQ